MSNGESKKKLYQDIIKGKKTYFFSRDDSEYALCEMNTKSDADKFVERYNEPGVYISHTLKTDEGNFLLYERNKPMDEASKMVDKIDNGFYEINFSNKLGWYMTEQDVSKGDKFIKLGGQFDEIEDTVENFYNKKSVYDELGMRHKTGFLLYGPPGCHAKGTKILMFDGSVKKIEDIVVGDFVMGPDSKSREVLALCRNRQEMVKIIPIKGEEFVVNRDHILHLTPSGKNQTIRTPINMKFSDYIKQSKVFQERMKLTRTGVEFTKKDLKIDPYILGLWLGDGSKQDIRLSTADNEIAEIWSMYGHLFGLNVKYTRPRKNAPCQDISLSCRDLDTNVNKLRNHFKSYNLLNNKHIPKDYLLSDSDDRLQLLAGLLDSDGNYYNNYYITQKRKNLAEEIVFLSRSLGFAAYMKVKRKRCTNSKVPNHVDTYYEVSISGHIDQIPVILPRKKAKPRKQIKDVLRTGFTYELLPEDDYYGFTLSGDHLYLTDDFTIHHNTGKSCMLRDIMQRYQSKAVIVFIEGDFPIGFIKNLKDFDQPYIFIFEEMTQNIRNDKELGIILNFLDGEHSLNQQVVFATTNYPEALPSNIADRPGRFDKLFEVKDPNRKTRRIYLETKLDEVTDEILDLTEGHSIAYLKEMVISSKISGTTLEEEIEKNKKRMKLVKKKFIGADKQNKIGFD